MMPGYCKMCTLNVGPCMFDDCVKRDSYGTCVPYCKRLITDMSYELIQAVSPPHRAEEFKQHIAWFWCWEFKPRPGMSEADRELIVKRKAIAKKRSAREEALIDRMNAMKRKELEDEARG